MSFLGSRILEANHRIVEQGAIDNIPDYFSKNYVVATGGSERVGHEVIGGFTKQIHKSFSSLQVSVQVLMEADSCVAWQRTLRGNHTGKFQGFPASGLQITWRDMVVSHFEDSLITKEWVVTDLAEALLRSRKNL